MTSTGTSKSRTAKPGKENPPDPTQKNRAPQKNHRSHARQWAAGIGRSTSKQGTKKRHKGPKLAAADAEHPRRTRTKQTGGTRTLGPGSPTRTKAVAEEGGAAGAKHANRHRKPTYDHRPRKEREEGRSTREKGRDAAQPTQTNCYSSVHEELEVKAEPARWVLCRRC